LTKSQAKPKANRPGRSKHSRTNKHFDSGKTAAHRDRPLSEEMIDKTLEDSFPASDPPAWTTGREPT
jgi:hypothetical protein